MVRQWMTSVVGPAECAANLLSKGAFFLLLILLPTLGCGSVGNEGSSRGFSSLPRLQQGMTQDEVSKACDARPVEADGARTCALKDASLR